MEKTRKPMVPRSVWKAQTLEQLHAWYYQHAGDCPTMISPAIQQAFTLGNLAAGKQIADLKMEIDFLRNWGNKDCTAMADQALREHKEDLARNQMREDAIRLEPFFARS